MTLYSDLLTKPGKPLPLGTTYYHNYTQFNVFSRHATSVSLLFFNQPTDEHPATVLPLSPDIHKTGDIWHIAVYGIQPGCLYAFQVDGPYQPEEGHRFNPHRFLLDPYARALTRGPWKLDEARGFDWNHENLDLVMHTRPCGQYVPKCVVVDDYFDWEDDRYPRIPLQDSIIYELHVKGFTAHSSSKVAHPGTFRGLQEKIPYLKELGVTAVEVLPIQEFDELENFRTNPKTGEKLKNFWGYSTICFFAPKGGYAVGGDSAQVREFKEMVKALHREGIEVILDVVFNHTAEGNELGPTLSFRGLDNVIYYMLENKRYYKNYSGCGNAVNCNHPVVRDFILDCLRYWVVEMHVDGFRFDLASILGRDTDGTVLANPPLLERIAEDPLLRGTKVIAEAWDAAGLYQVGSFPGGRFAEWNGKYRDALRAYWKGDAGQVSELASRIAGSSDLYEVSGRSPFHSINFITCHDGFTLFDLVSYNRKHNDENGEDNRDGTEMNYSANYGIEGPTRDPDILQVRNRQRCNLIVSLIISQGVPMILAGDEFGRSQQGNNNAWSQDNAISWVNWEFLEKDSAFFNFCKSLLAFRKKHVAFRRFHFFTGQKAKEEALADIHWYSHRGHPYRWNTRGNSIAFFISGASRDTGQAVSDADFYVLFNAYHKALPFRIPRNLRHLTWKTVLDTGGESPFSLWQDGREGPLDPTQRITLAGRAGMILISTTRLEQKK